MWDKAFENAEDGAKAFVMGLWNHQIGNQDVGDFSRHASYSHHDPRTGKSFPRVGSWMMLAWAKGFEHIDDDPEFDQMMLRAIKTVATSYNNRRDPNTDALSAGTNSRYKNVYWTNVNLTMAVEIGQILELDSLPEEIEAILAELAARSDEVILTKLNHNLDGHLAQYPRGFNFRAYTNQLVEGKLKIGDPRKSKGNYFTEDWSGLETSRVALEMLERSEQLGNTKHGEQYRQLGIKAANQYLFAQPNPDQVLHPQTLAAAINLMVKAHEISGQEIYLNRAADFANLARSQFYDQTSALPKVTTKHDFYEAITGGDNLSLALYQLARLRSNPSQT